MKTGRKYTRLLRAAPRKYRLNLEIAKKSNFSKLAQNEALRALITKIGPQSVHVWLTGYTCNLDKT